MVKGVEKEVEVEMEKEEEEEEDGREVIAKREKESLKARTKTKGE